MISLCPNQISLASFAKEEEIINYMAKSIRTTISPKIFTTFGETSSNSMELIRNLCFFSIYKKPAPSGRPSVRERPSHWRMFRILLIVFVASVFVTSEATVIGYEYPVPPTPVVLLKDAPVHLSLEKNSQGDGRQNSGLGFNLGAVIGQFADANNGHHHESSNLFVPGFSSTSKDHHHHYNQNNDHHHYENHGHYDNHGHGHYDGHGNGHYDSHGHYNPYNGHHDCCHHHHYDGHHK